jgi:acylphosphatase
MDDVIRRRARVHGIVQGVGFRFSTEGEADRIEVGWLQEGPSGATVESVDVTELDPVGETAFTTRH